MSESCKIEKTTNYDTNSQSKVVIGGVIIEFWK